MVRNSDKRHHLTYFISPALEEKAKEEKEASTAQESSLRKHPLQDLVVQVFR